MSLRNVWVEATFFDGDTQDEAERGLMWLLEALCQRNVSYLATHPNTPRLYKSGVVWEAPRQFDGDCEQVKVLKDALGSVAKKRNVKQVLEQIQAVMGGEHFCDIGVILELGAIDCFPLAQKIIVRSKSTGQYEILSIGEMRFAYQAYEALSYNFETRKQEFKSIVGFVDKGVQKVSKAHLSNGTDLVATDSHKFWTLNGSKQYPPFADSFRLGERTMGEYVAMYADRNNHGRAWWSSRSRILQAARIPALASTHPSSDEAYLAGIYAAEGFQSGSVTGIAQHKEPVRRKIEETLVGMGIGFSYDKGGRGATSGSGAQYRLLGGAKSEVISRLRELGVDSFDKRFPQSYLSSDAPTIRKMLDAHADGDGWRPREDVEYKKAGVRGIAAEYSTSSDELMEQIRLGQLILGNPTYTYHQQDHQGEGDKPIWRISEYNKHASKLRARHGRMAKYNLPDLTYAAVASAESFGEAHVGCIEVEGNHNFFLADGTLAANCDGIACWRVAELRQSGIQARPMMTSRKRPGGGTIYHAIVRWPPFGDAVSGNPFLDSDEDPSLLLGMSQPERAAERQEEIRKNIERCDYIQRCRQRGIMPGGQTQTALEDVLGLRRYGSADLDPAIEMLLSRAR